MLEDSLWVGGDNRERGSAGSPTVMTRKVPSIQSYRPPPPTAKSEKALPSPPGPFVPGIGAAARTRPSANLGQAVDLWLRLWPRVPFSIPCTQVKEYDAISRLDQWLTTMLLRIKKTIQGDEEDLR